MDLFKKGTLKSQSLNSRFLASNNNSNPSVTPRSLPVQVSKPKPASTPQSTATGPASKLKLTTTRQSPALKLTRENSSSQGTNDAVQTSSRDISFDKKAPVWNKGMPPQKSAKDYTDEELKAMHGISLVARSSNAAGAPKEGRWDDSDEDDAWNDTIDFGDGTKVTIGQATPQDSAKATDIAPVKAIPPPRPADFTPAHASPFGNSLGSPWKRSEFLAPRAVAPPVVSRPAVTDDVQTSSDSTLANGTSAEARAIETVSPTVWDKTSLPRASPMQQVSSPVTSDPRAHSQARPDSPEPRIQPSNDARYQYDQNTYDRHWQNPQPATREIYNSTTGRFEQIDASQKQARRLSHHDRKTTEVLHRSTPLTSGDARVGAGQAPALVERKNTRPLLSPPIQQSTPLANGQNQVADNSTEAIRQPQNEVVAKEAAAAKLDPSSPEFLEMQKKLMAERREQAIQRRKDQEAEETARKERARKKAEELAALAEKEKAVVAATKNDEQASKAKTAPKILSRPAAQVVENNLALQKATSEALQINGNKNKAANTNKTQEREVASWHESRPAVAEAPENSQVRKARRDSFNRDAASGQDQFISFGEKSKIAAETYSPSRNVWGAIGSKKTGITTDQDGFLGPAASIPSSPANAKNTGSVERTNVQSWSAFDGIGQTKKPMSAPESRVFDAADEVVIPEKHKNSSSNQSQNRTSSRFFPSATSASDAGKSVKSSTLLISPSIPPRLDSTDNPHYEDPSSLPTLVLPQSSNLSSRIKGSLTRTIDQVMSSLQDNINDKPTGKDTRTSKYSIKGWLDTQTRSVWEIKPLREGLSPRVKIPHSEKQLDWSRKERPASEAVNGAALAAEKETKPVSTTAVPPIPAWNMPLVLDTTTRDSNMKEPLIPPQPSLKLPDISSDVVIERPLKRQQISRIEQDRTSKYYTTRPSLVEEPDNNSPIRIKTVDAETQIPRRFGKRLDPAQTLQRKQQDVKRQPVNMSDTPGGTGFKRGFANRVRTQVPKLSPSSSPAPADTSATPEPKQNSRVQVSPAANPSAILQRPSPSPSPAASYTPNSPQVLPQQLHQNRGSPHAMNRGSPVPHYVHRESPMSQKYMPMQPVSPMHAPMSSPLVSRVAPPGLAAPATTMSREESGHTGHGIPTSSIPPPTPRGPPGIV